MTGGPVDVAEVARTGLSDDAVHARTAQGETNDVPAVPTRSVAQIVRANVLTRFNAILGAFLLVILLFGDPRDALFGVVLVANRRGRSRGGARGDRAVSAVRTRLRRLIRPPYGASLGVLILAAACVGGVVVLHLGRPDLDPLSHVLSEYANGPFGAVMTAVFYAVGAACLALGWRLRTAVRWHSVTAATPALLLVAGVGMIVAGAFEVGLPNAPDTVDETVHSLASIGAFVALLVAMALFAVACGRDPDWTGFRRTAVVFAGVAIAAAAVSPVADGTSWSGVAQRVLAGVVVVWLALTARRIRAVAFGRP